MPGHRRWPSAVSVIVMAVAAHASAAVVVGGIMHGLSKDTLPRPRNLADGDNPAVLYAKSYLLIRTAVGFIGILLPFVLIMGEANFLRGSVHVRGSLSAYYHTPMRDLFVASLCVIGFLLATYMAGQTRSLDFWLSLVAGVTLLGVVFFPTSRPALADGAPRCGSTPMPNGCSPVEQWLGETPTATIHFVCATVFILSLAAIAFLFAYREKRWNRSTGMWLVQTICGGLIIAAVVWVGLGKLIGDTVWKLTPLYVGEVISVWAFGVSWLLTGRDLIRRLVPALGAPAEHEQSTGGRSFHSDVIVKEQAPKVNGRDSAATGNRPDPDTPLVIGDHS